MSKLDELLARAKQRSNKTVEWSYSDVKLIRKEQSTILYEQLDKERCKNNFKNDFSRSGILPLHEKCTIDNYLISCQGQSKALNFACDFIDHFHGNNGKGFIFSGGTGTGKNHLAAAICNKLMANGKSCLLITVSELMMNLRKCYGKNPDMKEAVFIKKMIKFDLMIIDEIGLQRGTDNEKLIINQIIDSRVCRLKPTGLLTNCSSKELESAELLGERIMSRMRNGAWITFDWSDYRKQTKGK